MTRRRKDSRIKLGASTAVAVVLAVTLTACSDNAPLPTGPRAPATAKSQVTTGSVAQSDPLSKLANIPGACVVATRTSDGRYVSHSVSLSLPKNIASADAAIVRFGYRGWANGVVLPVAFALCKAPDVPAARSYFDKQFGGKPMTSAQLQSFARSVGVSGAEAWTAATGPHVEGTEPPAYLIDGLASKSPAITRSSTGDVGVMLIPVCDPNTDPSCGGGGDVPEDPPDPNLPPPSDPTMDTKNPFGPYYPLPYFPVIECEGKTDFVHLSTVAGFYGKQVVQVKAHTKCPVILPIFVDTQIGRNFCLLRFCTWAPIGPADPERKTSTNVDAASNGKCAWETGWYLGKSYHTVTFSNGVTKGGATASGWAYLTCYLF
jgi:hypothetical protein